VVDSGDLFFNPRSATQDPDAARVRADVIARAYARMGAAAVNIGEIDLLGGVDFLNKLGRHGIPLVSANVRHASDDRHVFDRYLVTEEAGVRIAIVGVCQPHLYHTTPTAFRERIRLSDPMEAVKEVVEELRPRADVIILLSDLGIHADLRIAKLTSGIDFILGGHQGRYERWPRRENGTFVTQSYQKGMYVGRLRMTIEDPSAPFKNAGEAREIQYKIDAIDRRLRVAERAKRTRPSPSVSAALDKLLGEKAKLQQHMGTVRAATATGNRFEWFLDGVHRTVPEDREMAAWIKTAGIVKD